MNIMKEAHKLTREIKKEFPNVDYKFQLGLCISYLHRNKEAIKMVDLKGTEKQVKWAEDIRKEWNSKSYKEYEKIITRHPEWAIFHDKYVEFFNEIPFADFIINMRNAIPINRNNLYMLKSEMVHYALDKCNKNGIIIAKDKINIFGDLYNKYCTYNSNTKEMTLEEFKTIIKIAEKMI